MKDAILCDVDGTVALMLGNRTPFEFEKVMSDNPNRWVISIILSFIKSNPDVELIFMSGRSNSCYDLTFKWLDEYFREDFLLFMRPEEQLYEPDSKIKYELYHENVKPHYNVLFVIDDRSQVVDMWRNVAGLKVAQVAAGNF